MGRAEQVKDQVRALLQFTEGVETPPSADSLTALTWGAFAFWTFEPLATAYNNLLANGELRLLSDGELAQDLAQLYSQVAIYHREDFQTSQWEAVNQPFVNRRFEALDWTTPSYRDENDLPEPNRRIELERDAV